MKKCVRYFDGMLIINIQLRTIISTTIIIIILIGFFLSCAVVFLVNTRNTFLKSYMKHSLNSTVLKTKNKKKKIVDDGHCIYLRYHNNRAREWLVIHILENIVDLQRSYRSHSSHSYHHNPYGTIMGLVSSHIENVGAFLLVCT